MATIANQKPAALYDLEPYYAAGINPRTGLPVKMSNGNGIPDTQLKEKIMSELQVQDLVTATSRFTWYNLPPGLTGDIIERVLYTRGQGALVKLPDDKYYFLPFALDGTIDVYGRYVSITPLPFNGTTNKDGKEEPLIKGLTYDCRYEVALPEDWIDEFGNVKHELQDYLDRSAFILRDYQQLNSQTILSRETLNSPILSVMADCIPFMRTNLLNSTGVQGMRIPNEDEAPNVVAANISVNRAALNGEKYIPIVSGVEFQELTNGVPAKSEEFMLAMQSLDNYRLSLYGLDNGGLF
jgi:hypothetical protein